MWWIEVPLAAVAILPGLFLLALCRLLRRAGTPDPEGEKVAWFYVGYLTVRLIVLAAAPGAQPAWLTFGSAVPVLLVCLGFAAVRIRRRPEILFSPATIGRARALRERLHR